MVPLDYIYDFLFKYGNNHMPIPHRLGVIGAQKNSSISYH